MKALIVVDLQRDFIDGALAVPNAANIIPAVADLIRHAEEEGDLVIATADWHPSSHCSFLDNGGTWPRHCEAATHGAELDPVLCDHLGALILKGTYPNLEAYSGFSRTILEETLRENGVTEVTICGLATDYCVRETALDAVRLGFRTEVVLEACRGVDPVTSCAAVTEMRKAGVLFTPVVV
jgi:nicotinamidase/pyrazinamidase